MLRKIISVVLVVIMLAFSIPVCAENDISLEIVYDGAGIWINGETSISPGKPIAIIIGKTGVTAENINSSTYSNVDELIEYVSIVTAPQNGIIPQMYIALSPNLSTGECKVFVRAIGEDLLEIDSFEHVSINDVNSLLLAFNEMDYSGYENIYTEKNKTTLGKLGALTEIYDSLSSKEEFYSELLKYRPFEEDSVNNISAAYSLVSAFNKVCVFAELNEATDFELIINKYNGKFWNIELEENSVYASLSPEYRQTVMSNLKTKSPWDGETLEKIFQEEIAIVVFKSCKTRADISNSIEMYNSIYELNLELLEDTRLNEYYISEIYNKIVTECSECSDLDDISFLFEKSVEDVLSDINDDKKKPSSGGSGGAYTIKTAGEKSNSTNVEEKNNKYVYEDVPTSHWAYNYIDKLYKKKVVSGVSESVFEPDRAVKREEFVKMLVSALDLGVSTGETNVSFSDVPENNYSYGYIKKAVEKKLIFGISDNTFGFGRRINREDVAVILNRILETENILKAAKKVTYNDANDISEYAVESVANMTACQLFTGNAENKFLPKSGITRAEACAVIVRLVEHIENAEGANG